MMDDIHNVIRKVDISQSELCIAYACMVYECKNKHGLIRLETNETSDSTYIDEYLPDQTLKVRTLDGYIYIHGKCSLYTRNSNMEHTELP